MHMHMHMHMYMCMHKYTAFIIASPAAFSARLGRAHELPLVYSCFEPSCARSHRIERPREELTSWIMLEMSCKNNPRPTPHRLHPVHR